MEDGAVNHRWSLKGMTALVTGGTKGIGFIWIDGMLWRKPAVEELAGFGAAVHTCTRNEEELKASLKLWAVKGFNVTEEDLSFIWFTKFESAFHIGQLSHPSLKTSGCASVVFVSSVSGVVACPSGTPYATTKGATNQLTKNLACEWAKDNIRTNCVAPWFVETALIEQIRERTPQQRVGEPEQVSSLVAFLCPLAASYITGQVIAFDGGKTINDLYNMLD
ncbi:putative tropinone reductase I [Dioscorea sansibarensis]